MLYRNLPDESQMKDYKTKSLNKQPIFGEIFYFIRSRHMVKNDKMYINVFWKHLVWSLYRNCKMIRKSKFTKQKVPSNKWFVEMTKFLSKCTLSTSFYLAPIPTQFKVPKSLQKAWIIFLFLIRKKFATQLKALKNF